MIRVAVALALLAATAHAQPVPVLGPGQEDAVLDMLRVAETEADDACELVGAQIDRDRIVASYQCDAPYQVVLRHPDGSESMLRTERFAIETDAPSTLRDAVLTSVRRGERAVEWSITTPLRDGQLAPPSPWSRWLTWVLLALLLGVVVTELRPPVAAYAVLVPIALAMAFVPEWGPLHEHLTFTARSDCAWLGCERERPGWLAPTYHAYHVLLRALPYGSKSLSTLSLALTLVALAAQLAWLRAVAPRVALIAVLLSGLHPIVLHASVAHSFWPLALTYFWIGAWLSEREGKRARVGALIAWGLAATTSVAMIGLVVVFVVRDAWKHRRTAVLWLVPFAFVALHALPFYAEMSGEIGTRFYLSHFVDHALFDPRSSPFGLSLLVVAGALFAKRDAWALAIVVGIVVMLPALGEELELGYPVAFLHGFPLVVLAAPLAALAFSKLTSNPKLRALPLALLLLSAPTAIEAWRLEPQPVAIEQAAIEASLPQLAEHRRLFIAPEILEPMHDRWDGDPIEARFPVGFYRAHGWRAEIVHLGEARPERGDLIYVGTALQSFHPSEIDGDVLDDPRRPILRALGPLEPVLTFEIATDSHPWVLMRVSADSRPRIELGFYRVR